MRGLILFCPRYISPFQPCNSAADCTSVESSPAGSCRLTSKLSRAPRWSALTSSSSRCSHSSYRRQFYWAESSPSRRRVWTGPSSCNSTPHNSSRSSASNTSSTRNHCHSSRRRCNCSCLWNCSCNNHRLMNRPVTFFTSNKSPDIHMMIRVSRNAWTVVPIGANTLLKM